MFVRDLVCRATEKVSDKQPVEQVYSELTVFNQKPDFTKESSVTSEEIEISYMEEPESYVRDEEDSDCSVRDKDYVLEQESSDIDHYEDDVPTANESEIETKKRMRWGSSNRSNWKREKVKRQKIEMKRPKDIDCSRCRFKCTEKIVAENRTAICAIYWACDFTRRKDFILNNVECRVPERRRQKTEGKKNLRVNSKAYFLSPNAERKVRVCNFFIKTLCISKEVVEHAFNKKGTGGLYTGGDQRGKREPHNKTKSKDIENVKRHIESFPVLELHYSRKSTKRQYLDCKLTIAKMHSLYKEICIKDACKPVSLITYRRIFCQNYNYSFFKPKKDQCQICMSYKSHVSEKSTELENKYQNHVARKEDCNAAKVRDKERSLKENNFVCCTFDLQCVLQIPKSDVSPMYYSRKICTYNLTVYELAPPNNAFCYSWTELNGKREQLSKLLIKNKLKNTLGEKVNWLKVKCFKYLKSKPGMLLYRYDHTSEYKEIFVLAKGKGRPSKITDMKIIKAYTKVRPISLKKKQDLLKLCKGEDPPVPEEFHQYYKTLPVLKEIEDTIPEPSIEDSDMESGKED
ncbi:unnamed protein product [Brassicogethes aeneus]|uniref:Uncharacterized protein n=1 Tax=Brassicogethes aeneus TaxID=1431903 RepID=A0A9P0B333_BRAAE|nr:unnamed protein product [Brassicogethes aeneus]